MMRAIGIVAALLLVSACGSKKAPEDSPAIVSVGAGEGELRKDGMKLGDMDISVNPNSTQCAARPDFVPLLPGAKIEACVALGQGGTVSYTVASTPEQVKDFYRGEAKSRGFDQRVMDQGRMFGAHGTDGRGFTVVADVADDVTKVNVIWGLEAK